MKAPLHWVKQIKDQIPELHQIPLFGKSPQFDWKYFSLSLASLFGIQDFCIQLKGQDLYEKSEIFENLGTNPTSLSIQITPIGKAIWIMSENDLTQFTSYTIKASQKAFPINSDAFKEGFYRFIVLESLHILQNSQLFSKLTLQLSDSPPSFEKAFCLDIEIKLNAQKSCWGKLILPLEFRRNWIQHFSASASDFIPLEIAQKTPLSISLKTGSVILSQKELASLKPGDFVLLDKDSYDADKGVGICLLMLQSTPLFNAKIKNNKVELIDYAFYYEDNMEDTPSPDSPQTPKVPKEKPLAAAKPPFNPLTPEEDPLSSSEASSMPPSPSALEDPSSSSSQSPKEGEAVAIKELPLNVTVEIAKIQISLEKLMQLTPGNLLTLPIHPDQDVTLTVNGKKIGRAELVYLGEKLGVRILEI